MTSQAQVLSQLPLKALSLLKGPLMGIKPSDITDEQAALLADLEAAYAHRVDDLVAWCKENA